MLSFSKSISLVVILILSICMPVFAAWTEPIHLDELNGENYGASRPHVSSDGSIIYFVRHTERNKFYLWEAKKNEETGLYGNQRIVSELGDIGGRLIFGVWLSEDSHRMYNCWSSKYDILGIPGWERVISMAERENPDQHWQQVRNHFELQQDYTFLGSVSLTSDELNIMWVATPRDWQNTTPTLYTASRESRDANFGNIQPVPELNELGANDPYLSADGLTVYFHVEVEDNVFEIWKGSRESLDSAFGDFEPLGDVINRPGAKVMSPCITPDGSALYFFRYDPAGPEGNGGIYVSEWVETPVECAVRNIREAIAEKEKAIEAVNSGIEKEVAALTALFNTIKWNDFEELTRPDVFKSIRKILQGVQKQVSARRALRKSIRDLESSLGVLTGENSPGNDDQKPNRGNERNDRNLRREAGQNTNQKEKSVRVNESRRTKR